LGRFRLGLNFMFRGNFNRFRILVEDLFHFTVTVGPLGCFDVDIFTDNEFGTFASFDLR
jgi:hypothetical protein